MVDPINIAFPIDAATLRDVAAIACSLAVQDMMLVFREDAVVVMLMDESHVVIVSCTYPRARMAGDVSLPAGIEITTSAVNVLRALEGMRGNVTIRIVDPQPGVPFASGTPRTLTFEAVPHPGTRVITTRPCVITSHDDARGRGMAAFMVGLERLTFTARIMVPSTSFRAVLDRCRDVDNVAVVTATPMLLLVEVIDENGSVTATIENDQLLVENDHQPADVRTLLDIDMLANALPTSVLSRVPDIEVSLAPQLPARFVLLPSNAGVPIHVIQAPRIEHEEHDEDDD